MKLFSALDVVSKRESQSVSELKRLNTVSKELENKKQQLQSLEIDFDCALKLQSERWEREQAEQTEKVTTLQKEVARLEERRKQNLFPLEEKFEKVEYMSKELEKREARFEKDRDEFEESAELLQEKLSQVAERESEAYRLSKLQNLAQDGIASQRAQIALQSKELAKSMEDSIREISVQKNAISRLEATVLLKEKALADKEKDIIKREEGFAERERAIQDRYATLERAIKHNDSINTKG